MSGEQRLNRVYPALTAKERGILILQACKAREKPDRLIYDTTPSSQRPAFNRYIRLMNAVNIELASATHPPEGVTMIALCATKSSGTG